jgi:hypothetical protein
MSGSNFLLLRPNKKTVAKMTRQRDSRRAFLAVLFYVGCKQPQIAHGQIFYSTLRTPNSAFGGGLALKQKNLSQRRGLDPFVISTSWSLAGWRWHLALQVVGRSPGQFPTATLHVYQIEYYFKSF